MSGVVAVSQVDGLAVLGADQPGDVALPDAVDADGLATPMPPGTDADGNPRCHTDTFAVDCVAWSATVPEADEIRFGQRLDDRHVLAYVAPAALALVDLSGPTVRWVHRQRTGQFGPVVLADETLIVQDGPTLIGLDLRSGSVRWERDDLAGGGDPGGGRAPELRLLAHRRPGTGVFATTREGSNERAVRLDAGDGTTRWAQPLAGSETLGLVGGTLLAVGSSVPSGAEEQSGPGEATSSRGVRALDPATGDTRWRADERRPVPGWAWGAPLAVPEETPPLLLAGDGTVQRVDPVSGQVRFEVAGTETAAGDGLLVVRIGFDRLMGYDLADGEQRWVADVAEATSDRGGGVRLQVLDGAVVLEQFGGHPEARLVRLDAETGEVQHIFGVRAESLWGWSHHEGAFAVAVERGDGRALWLIDDGQIGVTTIGDDSSQPLVTSDLVVLASEAGPILRHRDAIAEPWRLAVEHYSVVSRDPLIVGAGDTLYGIDLDPDGEAPEPK